MTTELDPETGREEQAGARRAARRRRQVVDAEVLATGPLADAGAVPVTGAAEPGMLPAGDVPLTPPPGTARRGKLKGPAAAIRDLRAMVGPVGLLPLVALMGLAAVERFDNAAFGVLGPEIRSAFHLSNQSFASIATLTGVLPLLLAVPLGYLGDNTNRVRLSVKGGLIWGVAATMTGLAPAVGILIVARLVGGVGQLVNEPVHASLLSDYYPPEALVSIYTDYRIGSASLGLIGSPLAGAIAAVFNFRVSFVVLAIPTFFFVVLVARLREPGRGESMGIVTTAGGATAQRSSMGESFRRLRSIESLRRTWVSAFLFGAGVAAFVTFLSLFFEDVYGIGPGGRGLITLVFGASALGGLVIGGGAAQRQMRAGTPARLSVVSGLLVAEFGLGIILLAASPTLPLSIAAVVVLAIGSSGFLPAYQTQVSLVTPPALRSQAFAWSLLFLSLGAIVTTPIVGGVADAHGQRWALLILGCFVMAGGLIATTARRFVERDIAQAKRSETTSATGALLSCSGVDLAYDQVQVLFGVDLEVQEGEIVALLGTNGAGKSTLLRGISGTMDPIGGSIYFDGRDITHADANTTARLGIAQVPGGRGVFPTLSVGENLRVAGWMFRKDPAHIKEATAKVLEYFPVLEERWGTAAGSLSGGEQQMLSLSQAFIAKPKLLLIDELSLGLAPTVVEKLLVIVRAIHDAGTTIILVEQSVNVALRLAQRAVFMEKGEVRFSGPTAELLERGDILRAVYLKGASAASGTNGGAPEDGQANSNGNGSGNGHTNGSGISLRRAQARSLRLAQEHRAQLLARPAVLEVRELSKRYGGVAAVNGVDLTVHDGEILGLIGPNGAGKTTIFDLIGGFTASNAGRVILHGQDVTAAPASTRAAAGLGRSFQDARLWSSLTVRESIAVALERHIGVRAVLPALLGMPVVAESEREMMARVDDLVDLMGLWSFRNKFVSELSTGSRRMVEIAAILAHRPSVLILDEPSSGIAQKETEALGPLLKEAQAYLGCSMLIIEHDMPLITGLADHLVALERGTVITWGPPDEVLRHPQVVESYLGTSSEEDVFG